MTLQYTAKSIPVNRIRRFKKQPREYFDPAEIEARAQSMKTAGQQTPITVERVQGDPKHDYELIDGESRWLSAQKAGLKEILAVIRSAPFASVEAKHLASLVANFNRSEHTPMEVSNALQVQVKAGVNQVKLAGMLGRHQTWVSQYLSLQNLHPQLRPLLHPRTPKKSRIYPATGFALAALPQDQQLEVLKAATRSDGRVVKSRVDQILHHRSDIKKRRRKLNPAKRKASLESALRAIGSGAIKLREASYQEAQQIFQSLKAAGEIQDVDSVEAMLSQVGSAKEGPGYHFPDLPVLKEDATPEEAAAHQDALFTYWRNKAGPGSPDRLSINIAYPSRKLFGRPSKLNKDWK